MSEMMTQEDFQTRCHKVRQFAQNLFQRGPDWVTFFREVLGVSGAARKVFANQEEYVNFERSEEYAAIQQMVNGLRLRKGGGAQNEPTRVITVRLPESLHEALKREADDHSTSMNKLCISKLLQVLVETETADRLERAAAPAPAAMAARVAPAPLPMPMPMASMPAMPANPPLPRPTPQSMTTPSGTTFTPRFANNDRY